MSEYYVQGSNFDPFDEANRSRLRNIVYNPNGKPEDMPEWEWKNMQKAEHDFVQRDLGARGEAVAADAEAKKQQQLQGLQQNYLQNIQKFEQYAQPLLAELNDPSAVQAIFDRSRVSARANLAKEYAARGLAGSGEYAAGLAQAYTSLEVEKQQTIERRQQMALGIQNQISQQYGQAQSSFESQDVARQSLALQREGFEAKKAAMQREQDLAPWKAGGQVLAAGAGLTAGILTANPMVGAAVGSGVGAGLDYGISQSNYYDGALGSKDEFAIKPANFSQPGPVS